MNKKNILAISLLLIVFMIFACGKEEPVAPQLTESEEIAVLAKQGDPAILAKMDEINEQLAAMGLSIAVEAIDAFTIGAGRPSNRIHQQLFHWVPGDDRRAAQGDDITYLVDQSDGKTKSGLKNVDTEAAIDRSFVPWDNVTCAQNLDIVKRTDTGADPDIFDSFFRFGGFGDPFLADIVKAGWLPGRFFDRVFGPGGKEGVLAFSVTFIFVENGVPTDINGDNYIDTALNEVYYNDFFGFKGGSRRDFPWAIDEQLPSIDVETVALHEEGHSLSLGHFGPPPDAVMNPVYAGIRQSLFPSDEAGHCTIWSQWPNLGL